MPSAHKRSGLLDWGKAYRVGSDAATERQEVGVVLQNTVEVPENDIWIPSDKHPRCEQTCGAEWVPFGLAD